MRGREAYMYVYPGTCTHAHFCLTRCFFSLLLLVPLPAQVLSLGTHSFILCMNIVDLTAPLYDGMPVYDGDPPVAITTVRTREQDGWELRALSFGSHTGTHVDVPVHMHASAATLDDVPLQRFCGPARVVHPDDADFPSGLGLLFEAPVNAVTARRLIAASPPFVGGPIDEEAERLLLGEGIITFTDLVNVDQLRGKAFTFYGLPLRIQHGDGSPVRAVAVLSVEP